MTVTVTTSNSINSTTGQSPTFFGRIQSGCARLAKLIPKPSAARRAFRAKRDRHIHGLREAAQSQHLHHADPRNTQAWQSKKPTTPSLGALFCQSGADTSRAKLSVIQRQHAQGYLSRQQLHPDDQQTLDHLLAEALPQVDDATLITPLIRLGATVSDNHFTELNNAPNQIIAAIFISGTATSLIKHRRNGRKNVYRDLIAQAGGDTVKNTLKQQTGAIKAHYKDRYQFNPHFSSALSREAQRHMRRVKTQCLTPKNQWLHGAILDAAFTLTQLIDNPKTLEEAIEQLITHTQSQGYTDGKVPLSFFNLDNTKQPPPTRHKITKELLAYTNQLLNLKQNVNLHLAKKRLQNKNADTLAKIPEALHTSRLAEGNPAISQDGTHPPASPNAT